MLTVLLLGGALRASASTSACGEFITSNGTTSLPGTYVGTVGSAAGDICQIGDLSVHNGSGAYVDSADNPSIFSFYWGGGALTIAEEIGNNGTGDAIDVTLWSLASASATTSSAEMDSIVIPFRSGPSSEYDLAENQSLAAGYYAVETQLGTFSPDPSFQINFIPAATPEPATLPLLGTGVAACAAAIRRRRMRNNS